MYTLFFSGCIWHDLIAHVHASRPNFPPHTVRRVLVHLLLLVLDRGLERLCAPPPSSSSRSLDLSSQVSTRLKTCCNRRLQKTHLTLKGLRTPHPAWTTNLHRPAHQLFPRRLYVVLCCGVLFLDVLSCSVCSAGVNHSKSGQKKYPHVAQLINGCLVSRLASVRRCAYETLSNVALFAKEHRVRLMLLTVPLLLL